MKIRFQADADFNQNIVRAVRRRQPAIDFQTADEADLRGADDLEVLAVSAGENRILVSHDRRTMPHHFSEFLTRHHNPCVFILSQYLPITATKCCLRRVVEKCATIRFPTVMKVEAISKISPE